MNAVIPTRRVLQEQRALVTGANTGIGAAVARELAAAGAKVAINYMAADERAEAVVNQIRVDGGEAVALRADVSKEDEVGALFKQVLDTYGSIDILINNAGTADAPLVEMSLADWQRVLEVNLTGQFLCARAAAQEFIYRGVIPDLSCAAGKIICMSSIHEFIPWARHGSYAASKGGVSMLMKTLAQELAPYRVRVNGIAPGAVKTSSNLTARQTPQAEAALLELIPYGRMGKVEDIARAVVWLASDAADYDHRHHPLCRRWDDALSGF